jgi:hypothetical protein
MLDDDFLLSGYRRILEAAQASGYRFSFFGDMGREVAERGCLLRHDVDSELHGCGPMLDMERSLGVRATYFLMVRSTAYNLFCVEARDIVARMLADGHRIGLHFMGELCETDPAPRLAEKVQREADWLRAEFSTTIEAVSFHQPSQAVLDGELTVPGLVNTYNRSQMRGYFYVSDTNMQWRYEHPVEIFRKALYPHVQLLIHPMWWPIAPRTLAQRWLGVLHTNTRIVVEHWKRRERTLSDVELDIGPRDGKA